MRCDDVTRELAAPTGRPEPAELARHLASCPACAGWSRAAARLDDLWQATRPADPSPEALDALWARAASALDAPGVLGFPPGAPARRRWPAYALHAARAAAVLVAATLLIRLGTSGPAREGVALAPPARVSVDVDQTLVVRIVEGGHRVDMLDDSEQFAFPSMAEATPHDVFNALESMASQ